LPFGAAYGFTTLLPTLQARKSLDPRSPTPELSGAAGKPRYEAQCTTRVRLSDRLGGGAGDDAGDAWLFSLPLTGSAQYGLHRLRTTGLSIYYFT